MNEDLETLRREVEKLRTDLGAAKAESKTRQIAIAVLTAVCIAAAFGAFKLVADAIRPGYFIHLFGGVAKADFKIPSDFFEAEVSPGAASASKTIEGPATVVFMGDAQGRSVGQTRSDIWVSLSLDGTQQAAEFNWTPAGNAIEHHANAGCVVRIPKGSHTIAVESHGDDLGSVSTKLFYLVIYEPK